MDIIENIKELLGFGDPKCRPLNANDIQENCIRIRIAMQKTPVGSEKFEMLTKELREQQELLKKYKDAKFYVPPKDLLIVGGTTLAIVFFIALAREYPSALKIGTALLKMMPFKG